MSNQWPGDGGGGGHATRGHVQLNCTMMECPPQKGSPVAVLDAVQELADGLAEELKRSVAVDDPDLRLLVSSAHYEDVDRARMNSLVGRRIVGPTRDYVMESGAQRWREPTRLGANPDLGVERARWCFPLWSKYELLGFMWLIEDAGITDDELKVAAETAQRIEEILTRKARDAVAVDIEVESLVRTLVARERHDREQAAAELCDRGLFQHTRSLAVLVVRKAAEKYARHEEAVADTIRRGFVNAMHGRLKESFAFLASGQDSLLVVGFRKGTSEGELMSLATGLHGEIRRVDPTVSNAVTIGVGSPVEVLADVRDGFDQGVVAAQVARDNGQVAAAWSRHPLDGLLRVCLKPELAPALVPSQLRTLEEQPQDTLQMIATYLENAGNVNATADRTHLHRTTVYYRLAKFRERTGLDLDDGQTRLLVHLWLTAKDRLIVTD